ncbi:MAG: SDR family oxidoreductase [Pseudomonadota bacterium]
MATDKAALAQIGQRFSLDGRVALVTGASGGLGSRFAHTLAEAGAQVVLAGRRTDVLEDLRQELPGGTKNHLAIAMDVTDRYMVSRSIADVATDFGTIDIVVNNSGIASGSAALEESDETWDSVFGVNLDGPRAVSLAVARGLVEAGKPGSIVNIASILGLRQSGHVTAYAASKAALIQMTKQHALEWARHGIRVNAIAPGYVETDMNRKFFASKAGLALIGRLPQRRLGQAEELDGALLLLASEAGSYISGSVLVVDGGHLVSSL